MRIAIATPSTHRIGGVETYLSDIIPALRNAGNEIAIVCEHAATAERESIVGQNGDAIEVFSAGGSGAAEMLAVAQRWRPDLVYAHGMTDPWLEQAICGIAPTVFFIHGYHGTCISGAKRFAWPTVRPCSKRFGPGCLACYFPRRCGGLNPMVMCRDYLRQRRRLKIVRGCAAVVTHSFHMYSEYARHGVGLDRLRRFVYYSPEQAGASGRTVALPQAPSGRSAERLSRSTLELTFAGRLDLSKGVHLLIEAAPLAARLLGRSLKVNILGDGPHRARFESAARTVAASRPEVTFNFAGWVSREVVSQTLVESDLVVFPSAWPEPFGLVGPEAGHLGIPVAAFDVGGVRGWLVDGVNGYLAPGNPPRAQGLATAIADCLRAPGAYQRLSRGAVEMAARFSRGDHLKELLAVFEKVVGGSRNA